MTMYEMKRKKLIKSKSIKFSNLVKSAKQVDSPYHRDNQPVGENEDNQSVKKIGDNQSAEKNDDN